MDPAVLAELGDFARALAVEAGALALASWRRPAVLDVQRKADHSLVTTADRAAEALIARRVGERYPDHALVGEETSGDARGPSPRELLAAPWTWVVDPIDGTFNYATGGTDWCVSLGLLAHGVPVLGCVYFPARGDELVLGWGDEVRLYVGAAAGGGQVRAIDFAPPGDYANLIATYEGALRRFDLEPPFLPRISGTMVGNVLAAALGQVRAVLTSAFVWDVAASLAIARARGYALYALERGSAVARFGSESVAVDPADGTVWRLRGHHLVARPLDVDLLRRAIVRRPSRAR